MGDDLINRQAAIDAVELTTWYHQNRNGEMVEGANSQEHQAWYKAEDVYKVLYDLPAVDAVPVVRCKDCKYNININDPVPFYDDDPILTYAWCNTVCFDENGFCSCGKRKETCN